MKTDKKGMVRIAALAAAVAFIAAGCERTNDEEIILPTMETSATTVTEEETDPPVSEVPVTEETAAAPSESVTVSADPDFSEFEDEDEETGDISSDFDLGFSITTASSEEAAEEAPAARTWTETVVFENLYVAENCYTRERAVLGATPVQQKAQGDSLNVVAITDTGYYKLDDGTYIHMDYVSKEMPVTTVAETEPKIITLAPEETTVKKKKNTQTTAAETEVPVEEYPADTTPPGTEFVFETPAQTEASHAGTKVKNGNYSIDFSNRYAYKNLKNKTERQLYADIVDAVENMYTAVDIPEGMSTDAAYKVYACVLNNEPELFWMSGSIDATGSGTRLKLRYVADSFEEIKEKQAEIDKQAQKIVSAVSGQSDLYRLKYFHDYIVKNAVFSKDATSYNCSIYHGLTARGNLQCAGYAKTFAYLCDLAGIECISVVGTNSEGSSHAWNVVNLNGSYYNVDCTWDDPVKSGGVDRGKNYVRYSYFLVPDKWLDKDHYDKNNVTISTGTLHLFDPPACTSTASTYFDATGDLYSDTASAKAALRSKIENAVASGAEVVEIRVGSKDVWDDVMDKSFWTELNKLAKGQSSNVTGVTQMGLKKDYNKTSYIVEYDIVYK